MASTLDSIDQTNHVEHQDNDTGPVLPPESLAVETHLDEQLEHAVVASESEDTDMNIGQSNDETPEIDGTQTIIHSTPMSNAEASFTEATSADLPLGTSRSSVARILVKPGQIFRVQVDNEVKEVHGRSISLSSIDPRYST